jgi:hypothetical protein
VTGLLAIGGLACDASKAFAVDIDLGPNDNKAINNGDSIDKVTILVTVTDSTTATITVNGTAHVNMFYDDHTNAIGHFADLIVRTGSRLTAGSISSANTSSFGACYSITVEKDAFVEFSSNVHIHINPLTVNENGKFYITNGYLDLGSGTTGVIVAKEKSVIDISGYILSAGISLDGAQLLSGDKITTYGDTIATNSSTIDSSEFDSMGFMSLTDSILWLKNP